MYVPLRNITYVLNPIMGPVFIVSATYEDSIGCRTVRTYMCTFCSMYVCMCVHVHVGEAGCQSERSARTAAEFCGSIRFGRIHAVHSVQPTPAAP